MKRIAAVAIAGFATIGAAAAQTTAPSSIEDGGKGQSLSSKLNKSDGVIKPKADVDPGIRVPAPDPRPNSMPVVPPAATGGGTAK